VRSSAYFLLLLVIPLLHAQESTGIKMTVRTGFGPGYSSEQTTYWQSDRKRIEYRNSGGRMYGPHIAAITRCDLGQSFELNLDAGEYDAAPYPPKQLAQFMARASTMPRPSPSDVPKFTVRVETTTVDTGERKQIFGRTARHVIITRKSIPLEGSHYLAQQTVTDGWYIDLDRWLSCDMKWPAGSSAHLFGSSGYFAGKSVDVPEFIDIGDTETGFPLQEVATTTSAVPLPDGSEKLRRSKSEIEVTELQEGPLDPALFEVPSGFKLVKQINRNPAPPGTFSMMEDSWERFKARLARFFNL
jgi:hypothetical protein